MHPTIDIKGEHAAITRILDAMKKMVRDMRKGKFMDSYRIVQIIDFLHTYAVHCHYEKEEKLLFPALMENNLSWTFDTINHLVNEHQLARVRIQEIDDKFDAYLSGNTHIVESLCVSMTQYVEIEEYHIRIVDNVLLPLCDRIFDKKTLQALSVEFKYIQDQSVGSLKYLEYYKLLTMLNMDNNVESEAVYY
jgi:hemerythrin-like domain-containing protein